MRRWIALLALAASLLLAACGEEEASGPDLSDPRAVAESFTRLIAGGDPAACDLIGPGMMGELTATSPGMSCAEAVESGEAAKAIFFSATGEEIVAALPEAELVDPDTVEPDGGGAQLLRVEPARGVEFNLLLSPADDAGAWLVDGTTSGSVEIVRSAKDVRSSD